MSIYNTANCFGNRNIMDEQVEKLIMINVDQFSKLQMLYSYYKLSGNGTVPQYILDNLDDKDIKRFDKENKEFSAKYVYYNKRDGKKSERYWVPFDETEFIQLLYRAGRTGVKIYNVNNTVYKQEDTATTVSIIESVKDKINLKNFKISQIVPKVPTRTSSRTRTRTSSSSIYLYHGTTKLFNTTEHLPTKFTNWFSTDFEQAELHIVDEIMNSEQKEKDDDRLAMIYMYECKTPLTILDIDKDEFQNLLDIFGINFEVFESGDYTLANLLCMCNVPQLKNMCGLDEKTNIDGWRFSSDQSQIMLCHRSGIKDIQNNSIADDSLSNKLKFVSCYIYTKNNDVVEIPENYQDKISYFSVYHKNNQRTFYWSKSNNIVLFRDRLLGLYEENVKNNMETNNIPVVVCDSPYDSCSAKEYMEDVIDNTEKKDYTNEQEKNDDYEDMEDYTEEHEKKEKNDMEDLEDYIEEEEKKAVMNMTKKEKEDFKNKTLEKIDTKNREFILGMITNTIRPYIYDCIYMLNRELKDYGLIVIAGGEAYNHNLPVDKRIFTPDIDTKLIIKINNQRLVQGYDEIGLFSNFLLKN